MLLPQVRWPLFLTPACSLVLLESAFHITNRVISLKHRSFDMEAFQRLPVATACQQGLSSSVAFCILPPNIELRNALKDINFNCYMILPSFEVIRCYLTGSMCTSLYMSCCLMPSAFCIPRFFVWEVPSPSTSSLPLLFILKNHTHQPILSETFSNSYRVNYVLSSLFF